MSACPRHGPACPPRGPACPPGAAWLQCWLTWLKSSPCRSGLDPGQVVQALVVGEGALGLGLHRIGVLVDADELLHHGVLRAAGLDHELDGKARILDARIRKPAGRIEGLGRHDEVRVALGEDRKSTRLNSSHLVISY